MGLDMKFYIGLASLPLTYIYLPLVLFGLWRLCRKVKRRQTRVWAIPLYLILAYLIPLGDVTWHSWNMHKACKNVGLHVYRTEVIDGYSLSSAGKDILERFPYQFVESRPRKNGTVWRVQREGDQIITIDGVQPLAEWEFVNELSRADWSLGVTVGRQAIRNVRTGEVIAEYLWYTAWRGWLDAWIRSVIDNSAGSCSKRPNMLNKFHEILIPSGAKK